MPTSLLMPDARHLEQPLLKRAHGADIVEQTVAALFDLPHQRCAPSLVANKRNRKLDIILHVSGHQIVTPDRAHDAAAKAAAQEGTLQRDDRQTTLNCLHDRVKAGEANGVEHDVCLL